MALPTASDNAFPKLVVTEGSAPASPSAGQQKLFIDSADHKLKRKDSGGTVTTVEGGSSGAAGSLGYAQITSPWTITKTTNAAGVNVTGLSVTATVPSGGRPVKITFWCSYADSHSVNGQRIFAGVYDSTGAAVLSSGGTFNYATNGCSFGVIAYHTPSSGSRTYTVQAWMESASTTDGRIFAAATSPAFLLVESI